MCLRVEVFSGVASKHWGLATPKMAMFFFFQVGLQDFKSFRYLSFDDEEAHIAFHHVVIGPAEINVPPL